MKYLRFILILLLFLMTVCTVHAETGSYKNGYIVELDENCTENAQLLCLSDEKVICRTLGIYYAENADELNFYRDNFDVSSYEEDICAELFEIPDDTGYTSRWDAPLLNLPRVWDYALPTENINVAIIDSGVASGHEDIDYDKIKFRRNIAEDSDDIEDKVGHGTSVAGIIGASRNNGKGSFGIAYGVNLLIFKITETSLFDYSLTLAALGYIIDNNLDVDVINISLGTMATGHLKSTQILVNELVNRGVIITAAAGNNGTQALNYPAACDGVIGVGSVNSSLEKSAFSQYNSSVFITAPGENIYVPTLNNNYSNRRGTSFSSPYIAAIAALVKAADKNVSYDEFSQLLKSTALDRGDEGYDEYYGWGVVQPLAMLDSISEKCSLMYNRQSGIISDIQSSENTTTLTLKPAGRPYDIFIPVYGEDGSITRMYKQAVDSETDTIVLDGFCGFDENTKLFCWDKSLHPMYKTE